MTKRNEIIKDLNCDELCFVETKDALKEQAENMRHDKQCPPC